MHRSSSPRARAPRALQTAWPVLVAIALHAAPASAEPLAPRAELSDAEVTQRLDFIETRLRLGTGSAQRWWYGWFFGWSAVTAGQAIAAIVTTDRGLRVDSAVSAVSSGIGVLSLGVVPFPARYAARSLYELPAATPGERRSKLARAEQLLKASAKAEASSLTWLAHVISAGTSVGVGLVLWLVYDRPESGVRNALIGIALGEAQFITQPTDAIRDWDAYRQQWAPLEATAPRKDAVRWTFTPMVGGLGVVGQF